MTSDIQISKTLSYWLRHRPDAAGLELSSEGWANVDAILAAFDRENIDADWERLLHVVDTNDKARFEISGNGDLIRARQGHSITVDGAWVRAAPPDVLYHGTVERFIASIKATGLLPMKRHHVHLSLDAATAARVGSRRGSPIVLRVHAARLASDGADFFVTENKVWLVSHVPPAYLEVMPD